MNDGNRAYHELRTPPDVQPTGCPKNAEFTPFDQTYLSNPYDILRQLNDEQPYFYAEKFGYLVVTRMDDLIEIFKDHDIFSSGNVQDPVFPICAQAASVLATEDFNPVAVMSNRQPPDHARIRNCLLYTSPSPRDQRGSRMPSSA